MNNFIDWWGQFWTECKQFWRMWSVWFFAALAASPQVIPALDPSIRDALPVWMRSALSAFCVLGVFVRIVEQKNNKK